MTGAQARPGPLEFEGRWLWHNGDHRLADQGVYADHLPAEVFARLTGFLPRNGRVTELVRGYPTYADAMAAYERATTGG